MAAMLTSSATPLKCEKRMRRIEGKGIQRMHARMASTTTTGSRAAANVQCRSSRPIENDVGVAIGRRKIMVQGGILSSVIQFVNLSSTNTSFMLAKADEEPGFQICRDECEGLSTAEVKSSSTGLKYKDLKVGDGEEPPLGYQILVNY